MVMPKTRTFCLIASPIINRVELHWIFQVDFISLLFFVSVFRSLVSVITPAKGIVD